LNILSSRVVDPGAGIHQLDLVAVVVLEDSRLDQSQSPPEHMQSQSGLVEWH
jgi:hypothetical protein